jgi:hypothetical protein
MEIKDILASYAAARNERLELDKQSALLAEQEKSLLDMLTAAGATDGYYGPYKLAVTTKRVPRVPPEGWPLFHRWILENAALDCVQKRLTDSAVMARVNAGEIVPGVLVDDKVTYKVSV